MVNVEHYAWLKKGVQAWNDWRANNYSIIPDLNEANLTGADLTGAKLTKANLSDADLTGADLTGAKLTKANLTKANLRGTNLSDADLTGADLTGAKLTKANLNDADLRWANLSDTDLNEATLIRANLRGANLSKANLNRANLSRVNFRDADLSRANLSDADLNEANLTDANLTGANLRRLDLTGVDLTRSKLTGANLTEANLTGANLRRLDLKEANLSGAFLVDANLDNANLSKANLSAAFLNNVDISGANPNDTGVEEANKYGLEFSRTNLSGTNLNNVFLVNANIKYANLSGLDLSGADLTGADLSYSDLRGTSLNGAGLIRTQALGTDFTNAKFTGVCLEDWNINSATKLNDINCQYIYLKSDKQERRPSIGEFAPGQFTKLFQKALETVDLIFSDGIDWKAFLLSFEELQAEYGEENLSVQAIEKKSGGAFVIRLEVPPEANKADIESQAKALYEIKLNALEKMYRKELQAKNEQIIIYKEKSADIMSLAKEMAARPIQNIIDAKFTLKSKSMSESYQSKYDQKDSNNQIVDTAQTGSNPIFNQYNSSEQKKTLAKAASEIQKLLKQLEETNPTATEPDKVAYVNDETTPSFKRHVVGAFQAGGETAIDEFILENKYLKVAKAAIKGWVKPAS